VIAVGLGLVVAVAAGVVFMRGGGGSSRIDEKVMAGPTERAVELSGAGRLDIAGTFRLPEQTRGEPVPAVLIIPGFGPTNRNGVPGPDGEEDPLYRDVSQKLADGGMASLRYDKRGTGRSVLPSGTTLSFADFEADARAGIDFLAERRDVDSAALAVVGHDEGALVAMRLAAADPRVTAVVLISSPGRPLVDVIADDFRTTGGDDSATRLRAIVAGLLTNGSLPPREELPPEFRDFFPADHVPYLREIFSVDPVVYARAVKVPALVVRGERATFSTAADSERLVQALGPDAEVVIAAAAGPSLALMGERRERGGRGREPGVTGEGPPRPPRERDAASMDRILSWLGERLVTHHG